MNKIWLFYAGAFLLAAGTGSVPSLRTHLKLPSRRRVLFWQPDSIQTIPTCNATYWKRSV
jgi:hypothetical protein